MSFSESNGQTFILLHESCVSLDVGKHDGSQLSLSGRQNFRTIINLSTFGEFARRMPILITKAFDKVGSTSKPDLMGDFGDSERSFFEQLQAFGKSNIANELACRKMSLFLDFPKQV